jgi:hypothetical protein
LGQQVKVLAADDTGEPSIDAWAGARAALDDLHAVCELVELLEPARFDQLRARLARTSELLARAGRQASTAQLTRTQANDVTALEAFELGRRYEHELTEAQAAREEFIIVWTKTVKKVSPLRAAASATRAES